MRGSVGTCKETGKQMFKSRKVARVVRRQTAPGLTSFPCDSCGHFHNGHLSLFVKHGHVERPHRR
jgi:hypothetical protein